MKSSLEEMAPWESLSGREQGQGEQRGAEVIGDATPASLQEDKRATPPSQYL